MEKEQAFRMMLSFLDEIPCMMMCYLLRRKRTVWEYVIIAANLYSVLIHHCVKHFVLSYVKGEFYLEHDEFERSITSGEHPYQQPHEDT